MKAFAAALAVLSVAAFCYQVSSSKRAVHVSGPCCLQYVSREIPLSRVKAYESTQSHCPQPGMIFTTRNDILLCVNPEDKWVQRIMKHLDDQAGKGEMAP
ncbi:CCL4 protein, partial [Nothoprocta ornata]|nr:CCL4 protein [Nothoprocta ornata]